MAASIAARAARWGSRRRGGRSGACRRSTKSRPWQSVASIERSPATASQPASSSATAPRYCRRSPAERCHRRPPRQPRSTPALLARTPDESDCRDGAQSRRATDRGRHDQTATRVAAAAGAAAAYPPHQGSGVSRPPASTAVATSACALCPTASPPAQAGDGGSSIMPWTPSVQSTSLSAARRSRGPKTSTGPPAPSRYCGPGRFGRSRESLGGRDLACRDPGATIECSSVIGSPRHLKPDMRASHRHWR